MTTAAGETLVYTILADQTASSSNLDNWAVNHDTFHNVYGILSRITSSEVKANLQVYQVLILPSAVEYRTAPRLGLAVVELLTR